MTKNKIIINRTVKIVKNFFNSLKMLVSFECLFTCPGKKILLTEELFLYNAGRKYVKKGKT